MNAFRTVFKYIFVIYVSVLVNTGLTVVERAQIKENLRIAESLIIQKETTADFFQQFLAARQLNEDLYRFEIGQSVVTVLDTTDGGGGTGFFVETKSGKTVVVTNKHVCGLETTKNIVLFDGTKHFAKVLFVSPTTDLCIVDFNAGKPLVIGLQPRYGEIVTIVGHPLLFPTAVSSGPVLNPAEFPDVPRAFMTNIYVLPGNSGSPAVNAKGEVIGVLFAVSTESNRFSYIIALVDLNELLAQF